MLQRGITKAQFVNSWQAQTQTKIAVGGTPSASRMFRLGTDVWEVWVYDIYNPQSVRSGLPFVDHQEHVAFKNGLLEEWGIGSLPITLQENPNKIGIDLKVR
jgi:hypothetical protein